ncbi:MAG TPA: translocation/assembly module TamB domain-containing protein [Chthoniobacterales bacterium]|nr:translocation/assembly module TamB domain-containing protein [Chthoniobacterales bacterium]
MDENFLGLSRPPRTWWWWTGRALILLLALFLIFHRPILFRIGRALADHYAAKANLKIDCTLEGTIFTSLGVRNLHVSPIGSTIVESIDVDSIRVQYSLWDLVRRGMTEVLKSAEVRNARVILDPTKAALKPKVPPPDEPMKLFPVFPERLLISDASVLVRSTTEKPDFVLEHLVLELDPKRPGELRAGLLQIPNADAWKNIAGKTSYTNKNLVISGLVFDEQNQFRLIAFDASHIAAGSLEVVLDASLAGGTIAGSVALSETKQSLNTKLRLVAENVSLDTLRGYLGRPPEFLAGDVERLAIEADGVINSPRTWVGSLQARINNLRQDTLFFDRVTLAATARDGTATLDGAEANNGANKIALKGSTDLPNHIREFGRNGANFEISGSLPDLQSLTARFPKPLTGTASITGTADIRDAVLRADLSFSGGPVAYGDASAAQVAGTLKASKQMPPPNQTKPYYSDLRSQIHLEMTDVRSAENIFDSVTADVVTEGPNVRLERFAGLRKNNSIVASGDYLLPENFDQIATQPGSVSLSIGAIELGDYWPEDSPNRITGPMQVSGEVTLTNGRANGQLSLYSSNLKFRTVVVPEVSAQVVVSDNAVYVNDFTAKLNEIDFIAGHGVFSLDKPWHYSGKLSANVRDLARLKPILAAAGNNNDIAGSLVIDWEGSGDAADFKNSGRLKLVLEKGRYANLRALQANIDADYSPEGLNVPTIFLGSDKMSFQAILTAKGETLEVSKIQIDQGQAKYAAGYIALPFVWSRLGTGEPLFVSDGKVLVSFQSENLDLKKLFADLGAPALGTGLLNVKLDAEGTLEAVNGRLEVQMRDLHSAEYPKLEPATFNLVAELQNNTLNFNGRLQQTKIQPILLTGNVPFNIAKIIEEKRLDEDTPLTAKVQMPRSSVNFLRQFVPGVTQLDGDLVLDVNVGGTIAKPSLSGSGDITINMARFTNPTLPSLSGFKSRLTFDGDVLRFERFNGDLAGGPFSVAGQVTFPKLTEPNLDFQLKAQSVLVARNDTLTARADADLRVIGPLKAATVTGSVALTNSSLLKNLDLIPIGLPGRPAPQPPSDRPDFSVTDPPIRDWKFDIAVTTKDPFMIRGNLANGGAVVDIKVTGTGLRPALQGVVRLENVEATLPFSRLEIGSGLLYFDPSDSFNPKIDLHGTSLIRDYTVHVYVYGTSLAPEAVFTSEPPLPQEEIISLLATGTTREELTGNNNVLAGRAAMLLVQQLYRKVFKKGEATKSNSVFDRLQVDVGNVDPRTGQQTATARLKLNEQFVLIGDLGVGGDFRGMVKYLIRFK